MWVIHAFKKDLCRKIEALWHERFPLISPLEVTSQITILQKRTLCSTHKHVWEILALKQVEELGVEGRHERRKGRRAPMKGINSLRVSGEGKNQVQHALSMALRSQELEQTFSTYCSWTSDRGRENTEEWQLWSSSCYRQAEKQSHGSWPPLLTLPELGFLHSPRASRGPQKKLFQWESG